ncbi:ABC transporter ATP-binding protein [Carnobacterium divergens]|uniref:ABC transporter ATP-binding protein/permease n=1 Tax=Carnobacterium divergens TaxID=2748 RepID=UPI0010726B50|nr:ABC transporter ATP-binding protein/permease [Carnobacterium divergens]TFJ45229.1 ABC transporter ATP-binding protein [Carnobacterium divergens]TFJ51686.1 ABC transporter ATP-binding protein [Carnobacterium divergens]
MLEMKNINKSYPIQNGGVETVLKNINFTFEAGDFAVILGPSGSGKSTLLNIISGLDNDYEGEVLLSGKPLSKKMLDDYHKNTIGFIFQSFNLVPHMSILENVKMPLYLDKSLSNEARNQRAQSLLDKVGLGPFSKKKPNQLSGGQKQRVAIARALANNPAILFADEPTGALDSKTAHEIMTLLKELAADGKTVIIVTHEETYLNEATKILRLKDGVLDARATDALIKNKKIPVLNEQKKTKSTLSIWAILKLGFKNFMNRKLRNILVAFGTSIGIIAILIALGLGNGVNRVVADLFNNAYSPNQLTAFFRAEGTSGPPRPTTPLTAKEIEKLEAMYVKEHITETYQTSSVAGIKFEYKGHLLEKVPPASAQEAVLSAKRYEQYSIDEGYLLAGHMFSKSEEGILLPSEAAKAILNLDNSDELTKGNTKGLIGKKITIVASSRNSQAGTVKIDTQISGVLNPESEGMSQGFLMSQPSYDKLLTTGSLTKDIYTVDGFATSPDEVEPLIEKYREDPAFKNYQITNGVAFLDMITQFTTIIVYLIAFIAGLSLIVAGVMIAVVLYIGVVERTKEIGVLRAIGYKKKHIRYLFISEALYIMIASNILSAGIAIGLSLLANPIIQNQIGFSQMIHISLVNIAVTLGITLTLGILFALYPASKGAKLDPTEALRYE